MYGKIFASLYQGTLRGRAHEILVFTNMIACADQDGVVDKHPRAIAEEIGLTLDQTKEAIANLEAPDEESRSREHAGARVVKYFPERAWGWRIVNYLKYRQIRDEASRREQNRQAQERWRQKSGKDHPADGKQSKPTSAVVSRDKPKEKERQTEKETQREKQREEPPSGVQGGQAPQVESPCASPAPVEIFDDLAVMGSSDQTPQPDPVAAADVPDESEICDGDDGVGELVSDINPATESTAADPSTPADAPADQLPPEQRLVGPAWPLKNGKTWRSTLAFAMVLTETYEGYDVRSELKKAFAWVHANPGKRKTAKGMTTFLNGWLARVAKDHPLPDQDAIDNEDRDEKAIRWGNWKPSDYWALTEPERMIQRNIEYHESGRAMRDNDYRIATDPEWAAQVVIATAKAKAEAEAQKRGTGIA